MLASALTRRPGPSRASEAIDRVVLHPLAGTLLFAAVMVVFFQLIFAWAVPAMDAIDAGVGWAARGVHAALPPGLLADFLADALIAGVGSVIVFLPQIVLLFTLLYLLEDVGYMARAAFLVDRVMGRIGLEGRAFVSLLSSYACAVPGIMATRTIPSPRHRLITILVAPLMTCSARLPVYALLIGAFVPPVAVAGPLQLQGLVLLGLYLLGALSALAVAALLGRTLMRGESLPFYMELPPYRLPTGEAGGDAGVGQRAGFSAPRRNRDPGGLDPALVPALVPAHAGAGRSHGRRGAPAFALEHSLAGRTGHALEPVLAPLGFDWKIGVGLLASLAAREVIVATLAQIYAAADETTSLRDALRRDADPRTGRLIYTPATVASLLVFFVFALQCMSTVAVMKRETNSWRWPAFAFGYLLVLAYAASFATHRLVTALGGGP